MLISELQDKKVLILGFGREGQDSFLFLRKQFPKKNIGIADRKEFEELPHDVQKLLNADLKVVLYFGDDYLKQIHAYDVIIKSPGIPAGVVEPLLKKNQLLTSQTNVFFANCPGIIIGVTGTKGKSTTASLIYTVLKAAQKNVYLIGNIEEPALQHLANASKDDIYIYELSSAQLELLDKSPHIAVFLNLYAEHLDYHKTFRAYAGAKANITKFQTPKDYLIFNEQNQEVANIAARSRANRIPYTPKMEKTNAFVTPLQPVFAMAKLFGIRQEKAMAAIQKFKPLAHRLQPIGTYKGITFYNDSLATIPEATIAALEMLGKKTHTLIAGGFHRGVPQEKLADAIVKSGVQTLILFPETGTMLWQEIQKRNASALPAGRQAKLKHFFVSSMEEAVRLCFEHTPSKKICLLSPAAASFNMFQDYKERGEQFQKFVAHYGKKVQG